MVRQIVGLDVAFAVVLGLLASPAPVHAQHGRGGFHHTSFRSFGSPGFRATAGRGFSFGFRDFDRRFDGRFAFGDPRSFDRRFDRRFIFGDPRFVGGFGGYGVAPGFFSPVRASGFGPDFVQPFFVTSPSGFVRPIFVPGF
jgi:hypothetical protein